MAHTPGWFDAHLDLAYIARAGRDMLAEDPTRAGGPDQPGAVTLPSLSAGRVTHALATVFTETGGSEPGLGYASGDAAGAKAAGVAQLELYHRWASEGRVSFFGDSAPAGPDSPLSIGILVEGADPISGPDELAWWKSRGVVAIGLTWARASRYAGGNTDTQGLTDLGRAMIPAMDALGLVHDLSHLSDAALDELLTRTDRAVIASHSNCRSIVDAPGGGPRQRHLRDETIREIARRGGMIGLNVFTPFIVPGAARSPRATIEQWCDHAEHAAALMGRRDLLGLGSDMDGGFSAAMMPEGVDLPAHLDRLLEGLERRGWTPAELEGFKGANWRRFWKLPK